MTMYTYRAINKSGQRRTGLQDASNLVDLEVRLKRTGLDLINGKIAKKNRFVTGATVTRRELITFFFNMEQLTNAGVPLLESLADLRDTLSDPLLREVVASLIENIEGGMSLSQAMAEHPRVFEKIFVSLINAGEKSGKLQEVFLHLTNTLKWEDEMASQTKQVLIYPAIVLVVVTGVAFFLMIYLVPQLTGFIKNMGQTLPVHTKVLLFVSSIFVEYWYVMLLFPTITFVILKLMVTFNAQARYRFDDLKLKLWPIGPILKKIILARFANFFAMLYASGISILECIAICRDIAGNVVIAESLTQASREIEEGKNLTQSFQSANIFPPLVIRMLRVGESTGALDKALLNVGYFYDRDVKEAIAKAQAMIGPAMTVLLGLMLGWIMFSVLMPIYDVISKVKI
ncbi:MAG: type II secretion system F family protein [Nitrosomonadales bacterium]|nr:MAG: type II secretion system F family protein [Nitrosomonadales bacterium]